MDCAVKVAKGSEEMGQQRSRGDTEEVFGRKEQFQEAEFPSDTRSPALSSSSYHPEGQTQKHLQLPSHGK